MTLLQTLGRSEAASDRSPAFPVCDPGPPCKNGDWCRCVDLAVQREYWGNVRDWAESEKVLALAVSMIEDLDELLDGHEPHNWSAEEPL